MTCTTKGCYNKILAKSMCIKCYYRVKRGGTAELSKKQQMALKTCSMAGCNKKHVAEDLCNMHYRRKQRHGDPNFINPKCNRDGNGKQRAKEYCAKWKKDNREYYNAYLASQKDRVKQVTPKWADLDAIKDFYMKRPIGYHVDHIVPINGENVTGLHVLNNLQYLPAKENLAKSNKF
jgi:hypothetical protein